MFRGLMKYILAWTLALAAPLWAGTLQEMIDTAPEGAEIIIPAGIYTEQIVIDRPVVLDGSAGVVIDGGGFGTVVTLSAAQQGRCRSAHFRRFQRCPRCPYRKFPVRHRHDPGRQ
jgi:nitrous oxidase accessory protein NosD